MIFFFNLQHFEIEQKEEKLSIAVFIMSTLGSDDEWDIEIIPCALQFKTLHLHAALYFCDSITEAGLCYMALTNGKPLLLCEVLVAVWCASVGLEMRKVKNS